MNDPMKVDRIEGTYYNSIKGKEGEDKCQIPKKKETDEKDWYTDYCIRKKKELYDRREKELLRERRLERKKKLKEYYEEIWEKKAQAKKIQRKLYNRENMSWAAAEYEAKMIVDTMDVKKLFMNL